MTEPEEIDEDLFADLYEGDEPTQPPQVPANVPDTPADFPGPAINDPGLPDENSMVDAPPEIGPAADNDAIPSFAPGGDSEIGQEWHEEPILSRRDSPIDHDIHGIGIKEDG